MYELSKDQVDFILEDVRRNGIKTEELQLSLLDHICCVIENEMSPDKNFDDFYRSILPRFFKKELKEIQEETDLLLTFKHYYAMKKVMLRSGMFSAITFVLGSILKIMHLPGANVVLLFSIFIISFIFLPIYFLVKTKEVKVVKDKFLFGFGVLFGILFCISTLFKMLHWPGATILWLTSLVVLFFLFLPVFFFSGIRNPETKLNTMLSSIMVLIAGGMLFTMTSLYGTKFKEEAIEIANSHLGKVKTFTMTMNSEIKEIDTIGAQSSILKSKVKLAISKIDAVKKGLFTHLSNGKNLTEEKLLKEYYNNIQSLNNYFFKDYTSTPENDQPKEVLVNLKNELKNFKSFIDQTYSPSKTEILNLNNQFRTFDGRKVKTDWEHIYFSATPFETIVRNLNQLEIDIRLIEASCNE